MADIHSACPARRHVQASLLHAWISVSGCLFEGAELNLPALGLKRSIKESFVTRGERTLMHDAGRPHSSVSHTVIGERCSDL